MLYSGRYKDLYSANYLLRVLNPTNHFAFSFQLFYSDIWYLIFTNFLQLNISREIALVDAIWEKFPLHLVQI